MKHRITFCVIDKVLCRAGRDRHALDQFVSLPSGPDKIQNAFIAGVASILRYQSAALQTLRDSVFKRQELDDYSSAGEQHISLIEAVMHTESIQKQLRALASICGLGSHKGRFLSEEIRQNLLPGTDLLSHLFTELLEADNKAGNMIRYPLSALSRTLSALDISFAAAFSCSGIKCGNGCTLMETCLQTLLNLGMRLPFQISSNLWRGASLKPASSSGFWQSWRQS